MAKAPHYAHLKAEFGKFPFQYNIMGSIEEKSISRYIASLIYWCVMGRMKRSLWVHDYFFIKNYCFLRSYMVIKWNFVIKNEKVSYIALKKCHRQLEKDKLGGTYATLLKRSTSIQKRNEGICYSFESTERDVSFRFWVPNVREKTGVKAK